MPLNRGETSHADNEDTEPVTNPEEIDIDEDDDDDDDEPGMKLTCVVFYTVKLNWSKHSFWLIRLPRKTHGSCRSCESAVCSRGGTSHISNWTFFFTLCVNECYLNCKPYEYCCLGRISVVLFFFLISNFFFFFFFFWQKDVQLFWLFVAVFERRTFLIIMFYKRIIRFLIS